MAVAVDMLEDVRQNWQIYLAMPVVAAFIGWLTKLVAVEMMFRPLEFVGIPPFLGWQGVVPRFSNRMAEVAVDLMLNRLLDTREIIELIEPEKLLATMRQPLHELVEELTGDLMGEFQPGLWETLTDEARALLVGQVESQLPDTLARLLDEMKHGMDEVLDLRALAVSALTRDKALTVALFRTAGRREMRFIVRVGIPFGFVLGLAQAGAWALTHSEWIMPGFGAATGLLTDWLALQMIFRPVEPKRCLHLFTWQGLFHKRRAEVAADYARILAEEILTPANILEGLVTGPKSDRFLAVIDREVQRAIEAQAAPVKELVLLSVGADRYAEVTLSAAARMVDKARSRVEEFGTYAREVIDLAALIEAKINMMTRSEFEGLLRPAFKQDEWKLVSVGAVLGFLIGEVQVHLLLS